MAAGAGGMTDDLLGGAVAQPDGRAEMMVECRPAERSDSPELISVTAPTLALCQVLVTRQIGDDTARLTAVHTYDESGFLTLEEYVDGQRDAVQRRITRDFDGQGRRLRIEEDRNGDGVPDNRIVSTFDADTPGVRIDLHDENADGQADFRERITTDDAGRMTRLERLSGRDDVVEYIDDWVYGDEGQLLSLTRRLPTMEIVRVETRQYDMMGRLIGIEDRMGSDRRLSLSVQSVYSHDPCQRTTDVDADGDGQRERVVIDEFDGLNRLLSQSIRFDDNTQPAVKMVQTYDGDQLIRRTTSVGDEAAENLEERFTYDPLGRLSGYERIEQTADGPAKRKDTYQYSGCQ